MLLFYIFVTSILCSCSILYDDLIGYANKMELFIAINENRNNLDLLISKYYSYFKDKFVIINNNKRIIKRYSHKSIIYDDALTNDIFDKMRIEFIGVNFNKNVVSFNPKCSMGYAEFYPVFYYTFDTKMHSEYFHTYTIDDDDDDDIFIKSGNWSMYLNCENGHYGHYGWYIERIDEHWYYSEEYWNKFGAIDYVKDDLVKMNQYDEIINILDNNRYSAVFEDIFVRDSAHKRNIFEFDKFSLNRNGYFKHLKKLENLKMLEINL